MAGYYQFLVGNVPEEINGVPTPVLYVVAEVSPDFDSFYNALRWSIWQFSPTLASLTPAEFRHLIACEIEWNFDRYLHLFPPELTLGQVVQKVRLGWYHAGPLEIVALERVIGHQIKVSNANGNVFQDGYHSDKPVIWVRQIGSYYKGMMKHNAFFFANQ